MMVLKYHVQKLMHVAIGNDPVSPYGLPPYMKARSSSANCIPAVITTVTIMMGIRQCASTGNTFLNLQFPPYL